MGFRLCKVEKTLTLRMDLSMSRDMRDPMRANEGFAANMLKHIIPGYSLVGACNEIGVAQRNRYIILGISKVHF